MYGIYRMSAKDPSPRLIATCYTKGSAKRACRHYFENYSAAVGHTFFRVEYRPLDEYWKVRFGYGIIKMKRYLFG